MDDQEYNNKYANDAWKQYHDIVKKYTKELEYRENLKVVAKAHERHVLICAAEPVPGKSRHDIGYLHWIEIRKNITSAREFAECILDACDFVEQNNPEWASHLGEVWEIERK